MRVYIDMDKLSVRTDEGDFKITGKNEGGLYFLEGYDLDGNEMETILTRLELKHFTDVMKVDEVLDLITAKELEYNYTDDGLNFISEGVLNSLNNKEGYEEVEWVVRFKA